MLAKAARLRELGDCFGEAAKSPSRTGVTDQRPALPGMNSAAVEEAADGVTQTLPIHWLGEMLGETGGFGGGDVAVGSESAKRDSIYLTGVTQLIHPIQATAIGET